MGDETGYGWHADFFNGWDDGAIPELLKTCPQGGFGNEDIGGCPSYKGFAKKASECKLPTTFKENVQSPGKFLPGCNPISNVNPAPVLAISPLNVFTNQCKAGAGGPPSTPPQSATSTHKPATSSPTTTMATHTKPATSTSSPTTTSNPASPPKHHGKVSCPDSDGQTIVKNGKTFQIECGIDHFAGNLKTVTAHSLGRCIRACSRTPGCVDVSLSGTACYLKKELGHEVPMEGLAGAKLIGGDGASAPARVRRDAHLHRHAHRKAEF